MMATPELMSASALVQATPEALTERLVSLLQLRQGRYTLRRFLARLHFADLAEVLEHFLSPEQAMQCFLAISPAQAAEVLPCLSEDFQRIYLLALPNAKSSRVIRLMPADDAVDLLQALSAEDRRAILGEMPMDADTRTLHQLLTEEPDTAAGLMSTDFIRVHVEQTVEEALHTLRQAQEKTFVYYLYLVDKEDRLVGVLSLKQLLLAEPNMPLNTLATFEAKSVLDSFDQELVVKVFRKYYNLMALPVVDANERLLGVITLDDIVDVIDEESQEDLYRVSGIHLDDNADERNLLSGSSIHAVKARLPWLSITMLGQLFISTIIASFQPTVAQAVIAFSFMPLLCGLAGNVGTQSDTITVRGLSLDLVRADNIKEKLWRETRVAAMLGGTFACTVSLASFILYKKWQISALLAVFILLSNCVGAVLGMLVPFVLKHHFKQDPAGMGGPFITTFMDLSLHLCYLTSLMMLLKHLG